MSENWTYRIAEAMRSMTRIGGLCAVLAMIATQASAQQLAGTWGGVWVKANDPLPVTLHFEGQQETLAGFFSSDALQVADIPFSDVREGGGQVQFVLSGDASTTRFEGEIVGDRLTGLFRDGLSEGRFELHRTHLASAPIRSREVSFRSGDVTLSGSLLLPGGPDLRPALLFLHGSGPEGRWANRYLARRFAEAGFVALIYDKRGVGQSTGDWQTVGFDALAEDAAAGVRMLRDQPEVDPARVGVYGHSQGGTIAPLVVARAPSVAFVIASAAGGIDPAAVERFSVGNMIGLGRLPPAEQADATAYVRTLVDVAYLGLPRDGLDQMAGHVRGRPWFFEPPAPEAAYWSFSRGIASYQPAVYWRQVHVPVLLLYGGRDERIPVQPSLTAITGALSEADNTRVCSLVFPAADHSLAIVAPGDVGGWPKYVPDYATTLTQWARDPTSCPQTGAVLPQ